MEDVSTDSTKPPPHRPLRTLTDVHRDVDFANRYREEFIKHTMTLAAAVFVFTVTFLKDVVGSGPVCAKWLMMAGWAGMIASLLGGLGQLAGWDRFYISYRDYWENDAKGHEVRKKVTLWRRVAMVVQLAGFGVKLIATAAFCFVNL